MFQRTSSRHALVVTLRTGALVLLLGGSVPLDLAAHHPATASPSGPVATTASSAQTALPPSEWAPPEQLEPWLASRKYPPLPTTAKSVAAPHAPGLLPAADISELGIPTLVLQAYRNASAELAAEDPGCHLPWWLLAGIGHVESGQAEGGRLYTDGTTRGRILGPVLNGSISGDAVIRDTDAGRYDGDRVYDRAVGPMQFIPSTWATWGADGNNDGRKDPNNIFDASLAAARYLCADGRNLSTSVGIDAAVLSYNHSQAYLTLVLEWGHAYQHGAIATDGSILPVVTDVTKVRSTKPPPKKTVRVTTGASAPQGVSPTDSHSRPASPSSTAPLPGSDSTTASASSSCSTSPTDSGSAISSDPAPSSSEMQNSASDSSAPGVVADESGGSSATDSTTADSTASSCR
jgi:Transglycosylase SLT domain